MQKSNVTQAMQWMERAAQLAQLAPPSLTAFSVGAVLIVKYHDQEFIFEGYSRELPGNTHAEECCLIKMKQRFPDLFLNQDDFRVRSDATITGCLYTSMEPCGERLSGKPPCADLILACGFIKRVVMGIKEPDHFIKKTCGIQKLMEHVELVYQSDYQGNSALSAVMV